MDNQSITVTVKDPHSLSLFDAGNGQYLGIIYVTSGSIVGNPIVSQKDVSVTVQENGVMYMISYNMTNRSLLRKVRV